MEDSKKMAIICFVICYCSIAAGFIIGFWALLFKLSLVVEMANVSMAYFGLRIICDIINGFFYLFNGSCKNSKGILIFLIWALFLGVEFGGLMVSINLHNSDFLQCPSENETCNTLVIIFGISLFSISFGGIQKRNGNNSAEIGPTNRRIQSGDSSSSDEGTELTLM